MCCLFCLVFTYFTTMALAPPPWLASILGLLQSICDTTGRTILLKPVTIGHSSAKTPSGAFYHTLGTDAETLPWPTGPCATCSARLLLPSITLLRLHSPCVALNMTSTLLMSNEAIIQCNLDFRCNVWACVYHNIYFSLWVTISKNFKQKDICLDSHLNQIVLSDEKLKAPWIYVLISSAVQLFVYSGIPQNKKKKQTA